MSAPRIAAIIPARMGSSRFPGKPLMDFAGLPMVEHVRRRAILANVFSDVIVATCDQEIAEAITAHGGKVLMTASTHSAATDRVAEAAGKLNCTHVINVQGDEILVLPTELRAMAQAMAKEPETRAWNAIAAVEKAEDLSDRSIVKCVQSQSGRILFCQRDFSKFQASAPFEPIRVILGILGYAKEFLMTFGQMERTPGEIAESIDQNRIIERDIALRGFPFAKAYPGVNEPREAELVRQILDRDEQQKELLLKILNLKT